MQRRSATTPLHTVAAIATVLAACSGGDIDRAITTSSSIGAPADTTTSTVAPAPSTTVVGTTTTDEGTLTWEITGQPSPAEFDLLVVDSSGRNVGLDPSTGPSTQTPPTLEQRYLHVHMTVPLTPDGAIDLATPHPLVISGVPRRGSTPEPCEYFRPDVITVCVGLPLLDLANMNYADTANQPGDISRVLDVILANPETFGAVDPAHIVYSGSSISGITGLWFVHPLNQDHRITAIVATVSFASYWVPAFGDPANWDYGPKILMVNGTEDTTITYELVRRTLGAAAGAANLQLLTVIGGIHEDPYRGCGAAGQYVQAWIAHELQGAAEPDESVVTSSGCTAFGLVDGGTTGPGAAAPFIPPG